MEILESGIFLEHSGAKIVKILDTCVRQMLHCVALY